VADLPYPYARDDAEAAGGRFEFQPTHAIRWRCSTALQQRHQARSRQNVFLASQFGFALAVPHGWRPKAMRSHITNYWPRFAAYFLRADGATLQRPTTTMNVTADSNWNPFRRHALGGIVEETSEPAPILAGLKSKTWETTIDRVPSWPEEARPLKKRTWLAYLFSVGDLVLVLLPVYFMRKLYK
jgi:hypothetical protein